MPSKWHRRWFKKPSRKPTSHYSDAAILVVSMIKTALRGVSDSLEGVPAPGLQGAIKGMLFIIDNMDCATQNLEDFRELAKSMETYQAIFDDYKSRRLPAALKEAIISLTKDIQESNKIVEKIVARCRARRILESSEDAQLFVRQLRTIDQALNRFHVATSSYTALSSSEALKINRRLLVDQLSVEAGAYFDSAERQAIAVPCFQNTRASLRKRIVDWIFDDKGPPVFWVSGMAGTGKSTIAQSIAEYCHSEGHLASHFFFSRDILTRHSAAKFFSTLAAQLSEFDIRTIPYLADLLQRNPSIASDGLKSQMGLLLQPLLALEKSGSALLFPMVVVIDALDECTNFDDAAGILCILLAGHLRSEKNGRPLLKFLVTSRPEPNIQTSFDKSLRSAPTSASFIHHNLDNDNVDDDIATYLQAGFNQILRSRPECFKSRQRHWPDQYALKSLVLKSKGLFIYASTILKFVSDKHQYPPKQLRTVISLSPGNPEHIYGALDRLYMQTLTQDPCPKRVQAIIGTIVLLTQPLSVGQLEALLELEEGEARVTLQWLQSVLLVPPNDEEPIRLFHRSFHDFVTTLSRSGDLYVDPKIHHGRLSRSCTSILQKGWPEWIHELSPRPAYLSILQYACISWSLHLSKADENDTECTDGAADFIRSSLRHWFDALIHFEQLHQLMSALMAIFRSTIPSAYPDLTLYVCEEMDQFGLIISMRYEYIRYTNALRVAEDLHGDIIGYAPEKVSLISQFHLGQVKRRLHKWFPQQYLLTEAEAQLDRALERLPDDHPDRPLFLAEKALCNRHLRHLGLEKCLDLLKTAVALLPDQDPNLPPLLNSLGLSYIIRYRKGGQASDVDFAIEHYRRAYKLSAPSTPRCIYMNNLAFALQLRFKTSQDMADIKESTECALSASEDGFASPSVSFKAALNYARGMKILSSESSLQAFLDAVAKSQLIMWPALRDDAAHRLVRDAVQCAEEAAAEAIESGELEIAAHCVEQSRQLLWVGGLNIRNPFFPLTNNQQRARKMAQKLELGGYEEPLAIHPDDRAKLEEFDDSDADLYDYYRLLHSSDPTERFTTSVAAQLFVRSVTVPSPENSIIYLNSAFQRCDALILRPGHNPCILLVPLQVNVETLRGIAVDTKEIWNPALGTPSRNEEQILQFLWDFVAAPIIKALELLPSNDPPRIWWILSGLFTDLPVHAASNFASIPTDFATNYLISSYLPCLRRFAEALRPSERERRSGKLFLFDGPPGLLMAPKDDDCKALADIIPPEQFLAVRDTSIPISYISQALHSAVGVHVVARVEQRNENPSELHFVLPGEVPFPLTAFRDDPLLPGFIYAATYPTVAGWPTGPVTCRVGYDLFSAGVSSVIAQQSPMDSKDSIAMAVQFYNEVLRKGDLSFADAAKALHVAGIKLRDKLKQIKPWARYIHIGV